MHCIEMIIFLYILKINPVNIRYSNRCVSLSRKRLAVHVLGRGGKVCAPAPYRVRSIIPLADRIREQRRGREFPSRRHLRYFGISRYIYGTRTRESLVNLSHNSEYLTNTSLPLPANTWGSLGKLEKNLSRHGADNAISKRLAGGKLVGYTATRVATELFVVYCNKL